MYICRKCWDTPCTCGHNAKVEIDDLIANDIIMLNKKGYVTTFSCQGHKNRSVYDLYVAFNETIDFNIPNGFHMDKGKRSIHYSGWNIKVNSGKNKIITDEEIEYSREAFHEWVEQLPNKVV